MKEPGITKEESIKSYKDYHIGDILIRDLSVVQDDYGVNRWGLGRNMITGFEKVEENDDFYKNEKSFINIVTNHCIRFSEHQVEKYFKNENS